MLLLLFGSAGDGYTAPNKPYNLDGAGAKPGLNGDMDVCQGRRYRSAERYIGMPSDEQTGSG